MKVLHELGHALACKHFGGEVHELGFMLLVFAPCLYCDVSDAWRLPSKWQRIAVSAAGMIVELVLAAVATIVWWYAQPGVVQLVALNVMIICTVNTLLVNGNPLLRYDGYYILSDLMETPNLWQRSRDVLRRITSGWLFGQPAPDDPLVPARQRPWLALYAVASKVYLMLVVVAIVWGLVVLLYPHHLQNLAYAVGLTMIGSALVGPVTNAVRLARNPIRRAELRKGRLSLVMATRPGCHGRRAVVAGELLRPRSAGADAGGCGPRVRHDRRHAHQRAAGRAAGEARRNDRQAHEYGNRSLSWPGSKASSGCGNCASSTWSGSADSTAKRTTSCRPPGPRWPIASAAWPSCAANRGGSRSPRRWTAS